MHYQALFKKLLISSYVVIEGNCLSDSLTTNRMNKVAF